MIFGLIVALTRLAPHSSHSPLMIFDQPAKTRTSPRPMRERFVHAGAALVLPLLLASCGASVNEQPPKPASDGWPRIEQQSAGLDRASLDRFAAAIEGSGVVIRHDAIAYQWGLPDKRLDIASASKAIYSLLVFQAVQDSIIPSLDQAVVEWMPELGGLNPALGGKDKLITWRHLINQTSCYGVTEPPGTAFDYNDFQTGLLWILLFEKVYKAPGESSASLLNERLFRALDFDGGPASRPMNSTNNRLFRIVISPLDLARIGSAFLHGGKWGDRQIIDPQFVDLVRSHPLPVDLPRTEGLPAEMLPDAPSYGGEENQEDHRGCYSHMWWLNRRGKDGELLFPSVPEDAFAAIGFGGLKVLLVVPSLDLIISWNTDRWPRAPLSGAGRLRMNEALKILMPLFK